MTRSSTSSTATASSSQSGSTASAGPAQPASPPCPCGSTPARHTRHVPPCSSNAAERFPGITKARFSTGPSSTLRHPTPPARTAPPGHLRRGPVAGPPAGVHTHHSVGWSPSSAAGMQQRCRTSFLAPRATTWSGWRGCVVVVVAMRCGASAVVGCGASDRCRCAMRCATASRPSLACARPAQRGAGRQVGWSRKHLVNAPC